MVQNRKVPPENIFINKLNKMKHIKILILIGAANFHSDKDKYNGNKLFIFINVEIQSQ